MLCFMLQTTQPKRGGTVTADTNCCANCVETSRPQQWGPNLNRRHNINHTPYTNIDVCSPHGVSLCDFAYHVVG